MTFNSGNQGSCSSLNEFAITFDIDWAPDWSVLQTAAILIKKKIKATWFVTHDSPALHYLREHNDLFELGLHPNFQKDSTHGKRPREVMDNMMTIVPEAKSVRTHGLVQSSSLLKMMAEEYGIEYEVSILLRETPNISPHRLYTSKNGSLVRIPFFWEDDYEMMSPVPFFSFIPSNYKMPGLKIFNYHPIHISLNTSSFDFYQACKAKTPQMTDLTMEHAGSYINHDHGTLTMLQEMTDSLMHNRQTGTKIYEIGKAFEQHHR